jgi:hypothetical protein
MYPERPCEPSRALCAERRFARFNRRKGSLCEPGATRKLALRQLGELPRDPDRAARRETGDWIGGRQIPRP